MDVKKIAEKDRRKNGYVGRGGVMIIWQGKGDGWAWACELPNPREWVPGCIAVSESGGQWLAVGGDDYHGADHWESIVDGQED